VRSLTVQLVFRLLRVAPGKRALVACSCRTKLNTSNMVRHMLNQHKLIVETRSAAVPAASSHTAAGASAAPATASASATAFKQTELAFAPPSSAEGQASSAPKVRSRKQLFSDEQLRRVLIAAMVVHCEPDHMVTYKMFRLFFSMLGGKAVTANGQGADVNHSEWKPPHRDTIVKEEMCGGPNTAPPCFKGRFLPAR